MENTVTNQSFQCIEEACDQGVVCSIFLSLWLTGRFLFSGLFLILLVLLLTPPPHLSPILFTPPTPPYPPPLLPLSSGVADVAHFIRSYQLSAGVNSCHTRLAFFVVASPLV